MKLSEFKKKLDKLRVLYGDLEVLDDQVRVVEDKIEFYKEGDNPF